MYNSPDGLLVTKMGSALTCLPNRQYDALVAELRELRADNARMRGELVSLDYLNAEVRRLRTLVGQHESVAHAG